MSKRMRKFVLVLLLALSLTSVGAQMASAGSSIRCGDKCFTSIEVPPPLPPGE